MKGLKRTAVMVVLRCGTQFLLLKRAKEPNRGLYVPVGGKVEPYEDPYQTGLREVEEETGIHNIKLHELLKFTNHLYFDKYLQEEVVKRTYWFHMTIADMQKGNPQTTEDIEKIEWHSLATARHCLEQTYPTILEVITESSLAIPLPIPLASK